jgi:polyhydroxyalkanoate synthesis regulator phasin
LGRRAGLKYIRKGAIVMAYNPGQSANEVVDEMIAEGEVTEMQGSEIVGTIIDEVYDESGG